MTTLRLSPSGPDVENSDGGPFDPGSGARLRLNEALTTVGSTTGAITTIAQVIGQNLSATPVPSDLPMSTSLATPKEDLKYRAELECDVMSSDTNTDILVTLTIQTSPDGTAWTDLVSNEHTIGFSGNNAAGGARMCKLVATLRRGDLFNVTDGDAQLAVRGTIKADAVGAFISHPNGDTEDGVGSAHVLLEELF